MAQSEKRGLGVCVPQVGRGGPGMPLRPPNPAPAPKAHPFFPPLSSHLQSVGSTPWGLWLLCKGVLAGCRDKKAKG